jgi:excisionase family DNA binding protein
MESILQFLEDDEVLTAEEAATMLKISKSLLYKLANDGEIPHRRAGAKMLFSKAMLRLWVIGDYAKQLDLIERDRVAVALRGVLAEVHDKKTAAAVEGVLDMVEAD